MHLAILIRYLFISELLRSGHFCDIISIIYQGYEPSVASAAEKGGNEKKKIEEKKSDEIDGETCDSPSGKGQLRIQRIDRIALDRGIMDRRVAEMQVRREGHSEVPLFYPGYIFHRYDR